VTEVPLPESYYSADYATARERFVAAANSAGAKLESYAVEVAGSASQPPLSIDVAEVGTGSGLVIVSSGLHGIEGFFGSAVQLAMLDQLAHLQLPGRLLLIHAINPWGFHHRCRVNESNVDLNRNFRIDEFSGAPAGYHQLDSFLNPQCLPAKFEMFRARAAARILRHGMKSLKESVASGQYEYPRGLFYGGAELSASSQLIANNIQQWVGAASRVFHIDLHTGLGAYGRLKLLCSKKESEISRQWFAHTFGNELVESLNETTTAYPVNGQFGDWLQTRFSNIDYRFAGAEYGTYPVLRVLSALRNENRYRFYGKPLSRKAMQATDDLMECFCPADINWRQQVLSSAVSIIQQGAKAL
jgi:hypothetical protein